MHIYDYIIIGNGLTKLTIAKKLSQETDNILILEAQEITGGGNHPAQINQTPINNGLRFFPATELSTKALSFLEELVGASLAGANIANSIETYEASGFKKFVGFGENNKDIETWVEFDMIHVTPPQSAPDFIKNSPLANAGGWVDVDKNTLQHVKYANIFSLGDASGLPTSKTGAAIRKQAPVVVANLLSLIESQSFGASYTGYTSCPLLTGYGKLVLAEFDYNNQPMETFPFDQSKERWSMYMLKKEILPRMYWGQILTGKA